MTYLRAAVKQLLGLFVSDWLQVGLVCVILGLGWLAVARLGTIALVGMVLLLAAQMVWFARSEARRRQVKTAKEPARDGARGAATTD